MRSENPQARSLDALFSSELRLITQAANAADCYKAVRYGNIFILCSHYYRFRLTLLPKQSNRQGAARAVDLAARSFDLALPGVAPPLLPVSHHRASMSNGFMS